MIGSEAMDEMTIFLLIFWTAAALFAAWRYGRHKRKQKYTTELSDRIERCAYINRQIHACEELLLAIRMSDQHHQKNIQLTWKTETELIKEADIWVDGTSQTTEQLKILTECKMEELITSLFKELGKMPDMRHNNVIRTITLRPLGDRGSGR